MTFTFIHRLLLLLIGCLSGLVVDLVSCGGGGGGKTVNKQVIDDLSNGKRAILGMGQTRKRMVIVLGSVYEEDDANQLFIYDMPNTSFHENEPLLILSNGGPASRIWPAFYRAVKGRKFANTTVTIEGRKHDYLLVIFQTPTAVLLYNIDADRVESDFQGQAAIANLLSDADWGLKPINFTGISALQTGFKSYTLKEVCSGAFHTKCHLVNRYTFWKCDGSSHSGVDDLDSCGRFSSDWYYQLCDHHLDQPGGGLLYLQDCDTEQRVWAIDEIRAGFTSPDPKLRDKYFPNTAGSTFLVIGRYNSIFKIGSPEGRLTRELQWIANGEYYNYSNFFQAGIDGPFGGRSKPTAAAIVVFIILVLLLCLLSVGCCLAGFFGCYHRKKVQQKLTGQQSADGGIHLDIGGKTSSWQSAKKISKSKRRSKSKLSSKQKKRGGSSSKGHHKRSATSLKRGVRDSKGKHQHHSKHRLKHQKSAVPSPHRQPSKPSAKVTGKDGWWSVKV